MRAPLELAPRALKDVRWILRWSEMHFGERAAERYADLIRQSLRDIEADPERFGAFARPELLVGSARTYHISFSRRNVVGPGVKEPRHFLLYRQLSKPVPGKAIPVEVIEVARILHDSTDLARHLPPAYRRRKS